MPGLFIDLKVDDAVAKNAELSAKLADVCPVSIFEAAPEGLKIVEEKLDECTLCDLCIEASPTGVQVIKLYES